MTKGGKKKLSRNLNAENSFNKLKEVFTTAPIPKHPNPQPQFIMEADASNTEVGAKLLQRSREKLKMHSVAFFLKKLTPTERNYDVGNP